MLQQVALADLVLDEAWIQVQDPPRLLREEAAIVRLAGEVVAPDRKVAQARRLERVRLGDTEDDERDGEYQRDAEYGPGQRAAYLARRGRQRGRLRRHVSHRLRQYRPGANAGGQHHHRHQRDRR